jgi:hypothetical protein
MKLEITEHDKKLLLFLTILVLVVCIGYWGIRPQLMEAASCKEELQEAQAVEKQNTMKLAQLSALELYNVELENLIAELKEEQYPMMTSDEVEEYMTEMLLAYDLFIYDFSVDISDKPTSLKPYVYSEKALTGRSSVQENAQALEAPQIAETDALLAEDDQEEQDAPVYAADISLRVSGSEEDVERLLEDLASKGTGLRLCSYNMYPDDAGKMRLDLSIEIYMCEE